MRGVAAGRSSAEQASPRGAPRPQLRKHLRAGQESARHHPEEPGAAGGSSTAAGTARLRGSGPVALQHLARSRRLTPSTASSELKKKPAGRAPRAAAVVAATAGASAVGVPRSRARAPLRRPCREPSAAWAAVAWAVGS
ncbi:hypothetical protein mRhiFer1_010005 [Rhinolophus ferrumequinum]|uniref:Uncharacterized protein n=1 Tax=Rhinolophus ferrumequinum TaxID=59479 RepID=A0A7J7Y549_RHIFE|nr:hypothetical protein mRhiFer1_010005 [Rhinolophus ferrumequinum]